MDITTAVNCLNRIQVKQDTATMPLKSRKTNYFQVRVYFRAIIHKFQYFSIKCRTFITSKPLRIHIGKQTAKRFPIQLGITYSQLSRTSFSLFISSGFAICPFMPVFFASCTSSAKAFAVMATIGSFPCSPGRLRIAAVAS